jgi:hypothetical protein
VCDDAVRNLRTEDTRRDRKACVEAKQVAVAGHPSDGEILKTSKTALEGLVSLVIRKGYFRLSVASITHEVRGWQPTSWNPSSFAFLFSLPIFLGFP